MDPSEKAVFYFAEGFNCSQSVFASLAETAGIDRQVALQIASGFGGGIARMQKTCGAVTGAVMAIGYLSGTNDPDSGSDKERTYALIQEFTRQFTEIHSTLECSELLGHSLKTAEDRQKAKELNLFDSICRKCVQDAVRIVEDLQIL